MQQDLLYHDKLSAFNYPLYYSNSKDKDLVRVSSK